ncbi:MAG: DinB family protein [Acidobacteriota bacterium]
MNFQELRVLLNYHYWARDRLLEAVDGLSPEQYTKDLSNSFRLIRDTLVHIYSAEWIWCSRWHGELPAAMLPPEMFPDLAALRKVWGEHELKMRSFLDSLGQDGVNRIIEYRTTGGQEWRQVFRHMLQHVVNHASYHRGQVTTMLRQLKAAPPASMDLIKFYRESGIGSPDAGS